jgi:hypothetical protein
MSDTADSLEDLRDVPSSAERDMTRAQLELPPSAATSVITEAARGNVWDDGDNEAELEAEFTGFGVVHQTEINEEDRDLLKEVIGVGSALSLRKSNWMTMLMMSSAAVRQSLA